MNDFYATVPGIILCDNIQWIIICLFVVCLQLQQCQDRMLELEKDLENPYDEKRVRYLEGKDLPPAEMHEKIEDVSFLLKIILS